jgi:hypothetical protein
LFAFADAVVTLGTMAVAVWFAAGWGIAAARVRRATSPPVQWQMELNALAGKMRIAPGVRLGIMRESGSPLATGVWRPAILLPPSSAAWSVDRRRAVLLHELAHIRRRDCRVQLLTHVACALYWFNPFVWMSASRLRAERERACDDEVLLSGARASTYAAHLLDIAREVRPALRPSAALAMTRAAELEGRLLAVLADRVRMPSAGSRWAIGSIFVCTTIAALGARAVTQPVTIAPDPPPRPAGFSVINGVVGRDSRLASVRSRAGAEAALQLSADAKERHQAAIDLAETAQSPSISPLQDALKDGNQDVREKAALALAFMSGREVVPALLSALRDNDSQVREKAAIGLALRRDERIVEPLLAALQDPDSQVREKVAIALGTSGDPRARAALNGALNDPDAQVREKAAAGLVLLGLTR